MSHPKPKVAKSKSTLAVALAAALSCLASGMANAALVTGGGVNTLMVTETVAGNSAQTVASVGPLTDSAGYAGQTLSGTASSTASALGVVPVDSTLSNTVYQNNSDAESAVTNYLQGESSSGTGSLLQAIATAVAAAMKPSGNSTGAQMGIFTFIQNVQIANPTGGSPTAAQVYATVSVEPDGQYQFLGTSINNDTLFLLYADYQQAQDAYYLPAGWTVPGAGELQWELLEVTVEGNTINGAPVPVDGQIQHTIQDNGAYDGIVTQGSDGKEKIRYSAPVAALISNQIDPLMKQYNATMGIVLYGQEVKAARNSAGQPLTAISVTKRIFTSSCGAGDKLTNSGQYGYLLTEINNEYLVQGNGSYSQAGQIQSNSISPNANFTESARLPDGSNESDYENDVVFPIAPYKGNIVNYTSGVPIPASDYVYVAPETGSGNGGGATTYIPGVGNVCVSSSALTYYGGNGNVSDSSITQMCGGPYWNENTNYYFSYNELSVNGDADPIVNMQQLINNFINQGWGPNNQGIFSNYFFFIYNVPQLDYDPPYYNSASALSIISSVNGLTPDPILQGGCGIGGCFCYSPPNVGYHSGAPVNLDEPNISDYEFQVPTSSTGGIDYECSSSGCSETEYSSVWNGYK